jgi:thiosulfate dehydrogenase [quinone] large subunit
MSNGAPYSTLQQVALITLRTLIGWHFLYEGYYKLMLPGWSSTGTLLAPWTSAGYFKVATGPLAGLFQRLIDAGWVGWIDNTVKISLLLIGISLMLGLFTKLGSWGALFLLSLFFLLMVPISGTHQPGNEGAYLIVNKTLIEAAAVGVLLAFKTGEIAGLDLLLQRVSTASGSERISLNRPIEGDTLATARSTDSALVTSSTDIE